MKCVHACLHACVHLCVTFCVCVHECVYVCMHECVCSCMHVPVCVPTCVVMERNSQSPGQHQNNVHLRPLHVEPFSTEAVLLTTSADTADMLQRRAAPQASWHQCCCGLPQLPRALKQQCSTTGIWWYKWTLINNLTLIFEALSKQNTF